MIVNTTKTARFAQVVQKCGAPDVVTLWGGEDHSFKAAIEENRVMTVLHQHNGKPDFGTVGYLKNPAASVLVFPKPLDEFKDRRVIGIKFDLLKEQKVLGTPVRLPPKPRPAKVKAPNIVSLPKPPPEPAAVREPATPTKAFRVTVQFTAVAETSLEVEAATRKEAQASALERAARPDFSAASVRKKVIGATEI